MQAVSGGRLVPWLFSFVNIKVHRDSICFPNGTLTKSCSLTFVILHMNYILTNHPHLFQPFSMQVRKRTYLSGHYCQTICMILKQGNSYEFTLLVLSLEGVCQSEKYPDLLQQS